jgi:hypothetical protein
MESVMLDRCQHNDLHVTEPTKTPTAEVDWEAWWQAVDKRIQEHLVAEREIMVDSVGEALALERQRFRENVHELRGPPGRAGQDGKLTRAKQWQGEAVFYENDLVVYEGGLFQAIQDTGQPPTHARHWLCIAAAGRDGRTLRHCGEFNPDRTYQQLEAVSLDGNSYIAMVDDPGPCPGKGARWQLLAAAGKDGATGPRGERGERGLIGPQGEPAPTITGWRVDRASYVAVPVLANGSAGAPLELRGLFEQFLNEV